LQRKNPAKANGFSRKTAASMPPLRAVLQSEMLIFDEKDLKKQMYS
jgi:hypothetical protein